MPRLSNTGKSYMNTSIRLFRKNNILNTSRKILQKSVNRSILCAASLKSNNASLAKRVAELQIELNAQRTATLEATTEATRLRFEVARLRAYIESKFKLKDNLLTMRELVVSMCESGMSLLHSVNDISAAFESSADPEQSALISSNLLSDTAADLSHMLNLFTVREPPKSTSIPTSLFESTSPVMAQSKTIEQPKPMILLRRPAPIDDSQFAFISPEPSTRIPQSVSVASISQAPAVYRNSESSVPLDQPATVMVQLDSPQVLPTERSSTIFRSRFNDFEAPQLDTAIPAKQICHQLTPDANHSSTDSHPILTHESLVDLNLPPTPNPPQHKCHSPVAQRVHLSRAARLKSKPIIDEAFQSSPPLPKPPSRSKRRRIYRKGDSDDDDGDNAASCTSKPAIDDLFKIPAVPVPRTVEVHMKRPGEVAFRAETKRAPPEPVQLSRSKKKSEVPVSRSKSRSTKATEPPEPAKPKSVFDISANQTVNMSVLPPTLDDLRKQALAKRLASDAPNPDVSSSASVYIVSSNNGPKGSPKILIPSQSGNCALKSLDIATTINPPKPEKSSSAAVPISNEPKSIRRTGTRYRRLCLYDEDDPRHVDKENLRSSTTTGSSEQTFRTRPRVHATRTK